MVSIVLLVFLLLTAPIYGNLERWAKCMALPSSSTSSIVHSQGSSSYTYLLQVSEQNPRWLNSTLFNKPSFIVTPKTRKEIQRAILCSKKHGLQVRVMSGGHDYEGLSFLCQNSRFIILDLVDFRSISINIKDETAWIQTGATIGELYYNIAKKSNILGFPAGLCPSVGVGGHFSGGGLGTMVRKYGLSADSIIDANLVDVNGRILNRKTMGEDVFWAIRGGGGASFGVITAWKVKLVPVPPVVTVFTIHKSLDNVGVKLVHKWQYIASRLPESLFIRVIIQKIDRDTKPAEVLFNAHFLGSKTDLVSIVNKNFLELGLTMQDCTEMSWINSVLYFTGYQKGEPLEVLLDRKTQYKSNFKGKSDFVVEPIPESVFQGISKRFLRQKLVFMIMDPLGGKMDEIPESEIPFPHRKGNLYNIQYLVKWDSANESKQPLYWIRSLYEYMEPYVSRSPRAAYINYRDLDLGINRQQGNHSSYQQAALTWGTKYFKGNFPRLARAKHQIDPTNFFTNEQTIPPLSLIQSNLL